MLNTNYNNEFSSRLNDFKKVLRRAVGDDKTYSEFYELVNVDPVYMNNLLNGRNNVFPNQNILKKIADNSADKSVTFDSLMRICGHTKNQFIRPTDVSLKKFDVWLVDLGEGIGSEQSGIRPVIIMGSGKCLQYSPVIPVAPITSRTKNMLPTHVDIGQEAGLDKPSTILFEQIRVLDRKRFKEYLGCVSDFEDKKRVDKAIKVACGVWSVEDEVIERVLTSKSEETSMFKRLLNMFVDKYKRRELVFNN